MFRSPQHENTARAAIRRRAGLTVIELMVVMGLVTVVIGLSLPEFSEWRANQRVKGAARQVADVLLVARGEAIRTGNRYVVYFGNPGTTDPSGNAVVFGGDWVPVLLIDDGPPATSNCAIDAGEAVERVIAEPGLAWGVSSATARVATDGGAAPFDPVPPPAWDGATFADPTSTKVSWVMFRPDGVPVSFAGAMGGCGAIGTTGSGGGAFYVTNGERDYAVILTSLGGVRVHVWNPTTGAWSS